MDLLQRTLDTIIFRVFDRSRMHGSDMPQQIQTYLARAGVRIAILEGRRTLQAEDVRAAIWLYHLPEQPDDPCAAAGNRVLTEENRRQRGTRGLLTGSLARFLDEN